MGKIKDFFIVRNTSNQKNRVIEWTLANRFVLLLLAFIFAAFLIILVLNVRNVNELLVERSKLQKEIIILKDKNSRLYSRIVELQSAERIIPYSESKLNMYLPQDAPKILEEKP